MWQYVQTCPSNARVGKPIPQRESSPAQALSTTPSASAYSGDPAGAAMSAAG